MTEPNIAIITSDFTALLETKSALLRGGYSTVEPVCPVEAPAYLQLTPAAIFIVDWSAEEIEPLTIFLKDLSSAAAPAIILVSRLERFSAMAHLQKLLEPRLFDSLEWLDKPVDEAPLNALVAAELARRDNEVSDALDLLDYMEIFELLDDEPTQPTVIDQPCATQVETIERTETPVVLSGSLSVIPVDTVLQLSDRAQPLTCRFERDETRIELCVHAGRVLSVRSLAPESRLTPAQLFYEVLQWTHGRFRVFPGEPVAATEVGRSLTELLLEGATWTEGERTSNS